MRQPIAFAYFLDVMAEANFEYWLALAGSQSELSLESDSSECDTSKFGFAER